MNKETIEHGSPLDALVAVARRLNCHEGRYGMASEEFYDKYEKAQMQDSADFVEWVNDCIELGLQRSGVPMTAGTAMASVHRLHSCQCYAQATRKLERLIEEPSEVQAQILAAFGYEIAGGVLHPRAS